MHHFQIKSRKKYSYYLLLSFLFTLFLFTNFNIYGKTLLERAGLPFDFVGSPVGQKRPSVTVIVIDTGFFTAHPDLHAYLDAPLNARDHTGNVEASIIQDKTSHNIGRSTSHGTHVAAIVKQIAPFNEVRIKPIKVGAEGHHPSRALLDAFKAAANDPSVSIVNISWSLGNDAALAQGIEEIAKAGKLVILAAGNKKEAWGTDPRTAIIYKTLEKEFVRKHLIIVGATRQSDRFEAIADFSGTAGLAHDVFIMAPGEKIKSAVPYDIDPSGYKECNGTSMATPVVAGFAATLLLNNPTLSVEDVHQIILESATKSLVGLPLDRDVYGQGLVNLAAGLQQSQQISKMYASWEPIEESSVSLHGAAISNVEPTFLDKVKYKVKSSIKSVGSAIKNVGTTVKNKISAAYRWFKSKI